MTSATRANTFLGLSRCRRRRPKGWEAGVGAVAAEQEEFFLVTNVSDEISLHVEHRGRGC